jgi:hypothetical protein
MTRGHGYYPYSSAAERQFIPQLNTTHSTLNTKTQAWVGGMYDNEEKKREKSYAREQKKICAERKVTKWIKKQK